MKANEPITINWESLGAALARTGDDEQAAFFNGFAGELATWDSQYQVQMQGHYVSGKIKRDARRKVLTEFVACMCDEEEADD